MVGGRMIGTLQQAYEDMEHGVYDFTKNGKCSDCGQCCSACDMREIFFEEEL